jgi:uncharacterized DUF497 family protein
MKYIHFSWDDKKDQINKTKHRISFDEAKTVFFDPNAILIHDPDHSTQEERYLILGLSDKLRLLVVSHSYIDKDEEIRIISARKADRDETKIYGG